MQLKNLLSAAASLAYLATATATDIDVLSPSDLYNPGLLKRGWSFLDTRQEPATPAPADPNETRLVQVVTVSDANGTLRYFPEKVRGNVGDVIQFHFYPKNHTVTESLFAQPCKPLPAANATETRPGQKSGFVPVAPDAQFRPIYNMILNDTKPMWIFCGQTPHCEKGMVMVINQNETETVKTLENYRAAAEALAIPGTGTGTGSSSAGYGAPGYGYTTAPAATATAPGVSTVTPAGQSGPSLVGSAAPSIQTFTGDASRALQVWGGTWSVGLVALVGAGVAMWL